MAEVVTEFYLGRDSFRGSLDMPLDLAFINAQLEYERGDIRPLVDFVRNNALKPDQRKYIAMVLGGDIKRGDLRKVNQHRDKVIQAYNALTRYYDLTETEALKVIDEMFGGRTGSEARKLVLNYKKKKRVKEAI